MFATRSDTISAPLGTGTTTPWTRPSTFAAGAPAGKIQSLDLKYGTGTSGNVAGTDQIESGSVSGALIQPTSQANSYAFYQAGGGGTTGSTAYGYFADANSIEGTFANGAAASVLDLYTVATGSGAAVFKGTVSIDNASSVTFTPTPEPTAVASVVLGTLVLAARRRRAV